MNEVEDETVLNESDLDERSEPYLSSMNYLLPTIKSLVHLNKMQDQLRYRSL